MSVVILIKGDNNIPASLSASKKKIKISPQTTVALLILDNDAIAYCFQMPEERYVIYDNGNIKLIM